MSNHKSNYPPAQLNELSGNPFVSDTVRKLRALSGDKPKTVTELQQRIDDYFRFCAENNLRPGIESLSLSLGVSRQSFWNWCEIGKANVPQWRDTCLQARQLIIAFIEAASMAGRLNPATGIFALKNIAGYSDTYSFEAVKGQEKQAITADDLPKLSWSNDDLGNESSE